MVKSINLMAQRARKSAGGLPHRRNMVAGLRKLAAHHVHCLDLVGRLGGGVIRLVHQLLSLGARQAIQPGPATVVQSPSSLKTGASSSKTVLQHQETYVAKIVQLKMS